MAADDYMFHKRLDKINKIMGTGKFNGANILTETGNKLPDHISLKDVVMLITGASPHKFLWVGGWGGGGFVKSWASYFGFFYVPNLI